MSRSVPNGDYYPEHRKMNATSLRDELSTVQGLMKCVSILMENDECRKYKHDPVASVMKIIEEKLDFIDKGLENIL